MRTPQEIATAFASRDALDGAQRFFLVGIAGAGMSALARMLRERGLEVGGTDSTDGDEVGRLRDEGISVHLGHSGEELVRFRPDAVILTDAIDLNDSPEVAAAKSGGVPLLRRSQLLGWLLRDYKVIAVTGTHGKTTTTGMVGTGLMSAGFDPLVVVGATIPDWGGPVHFGKGTWAVVEACEAYDSFHDLEPTHVVLTNLEPDHLDFHGDWARLRQSVMRFVRKLPVEGSLIYCAEDEGAIGIAHDFEGLKVGYRLEGTGGGLSSIPGRHNALNMQGALVACLATGADEAKVRDGLPDFRGAERRLQVMATGEITVIDDYAHHPTEIAASIQAIRERYFGDSKRLVVAFQPHLYSRTAEHLEAFAEALDLADEVVLTDIYPAREAPMAGMSSARIAELMTKPVHHVPSRHLLPRFVAKLAKPGDVVVGMGAGNISKFALAFLNEIQPHSPLRVTVLKGGDSPEREVSLHSGLAVESALIRLGYEVTSLDLTDLLFTSGDLRPWTGSLRPDVVFLATHGTHAEDGATQGLLELLGLPYTGSGIQASSIAMDKALTKQVLQQHGIRVPSGALLRSREEAKAFVTKGGLGGACIVKPNAQGSTVGLAFVSDPEDLESAIEKAFHSGDQVLVEEWIRGTEISTPVLVDKALPPVEIVPASGRYDFASKYTPGATTEIVPARLPDEVCAEAQRIALAAHRALGCAGATRTDTIIQDGEIYVLEVNTLPGMTGTSLLPNSAQAAGIGFDQLCERLVHDALRRHAKKD